MILVFLFGMVIAALGYMIGASLFHAGWSARRRAESEKREEPKDE